MDLVNETGFLADWTLGFQPDGREVVLAVAKATFDLPEPGQPLSLAKEQVPLVKADEHTGVPGLSATLYECDYALEKVTCDVLLNGSAWAPAGRSAQNVVTTLRVGPIDKTLRVVGPRRWEQGAFGPTPSDPEPFESLPISYDVAFGGTDVATDGSNATRAYAENPIGSGYYPLTAENDLVGKPLPSTEELDAPAVSTTGVYRPMAFGAIGRNFKPRYEFAGTYDQRWMDDKHPFLPDDFDSRYFQAAPADQQLPLAAVKAPLTVTLGGLTPSGALRFEVPLLRVPFLFLPFRGRDTLLEGQLDTIIIEPDRGRLMLTWRALLPLRRDLFEIKQLIVGEMPAAWHRAREAGGKQHYADLAQFMAAQRKGKQ